MHLASLKIGAMKFWFALFGGTSTQFKWAGSFVSPGHPGFAASVFMHKKTYPKRSRSYSPNLFGGPSTQFDWAGSFASPGHPGFAFSMVYKNKAHLRKRR